MDDTTRDHIERLNSIGHTLRLACVHLSDCEDAATLQTAMLNVAVLGEVIIARTEMLAALSATPEDLIAR